jgi:hypothetical protein
MTKDQDQANKGVEGAPAERESFIRARFLREEVGGRQVSAFPTRALVWGNARS